MSLTTTNGWTDQADVVWRARMAGDALGATKLHRPEWVAVDEVSKTVYLTLTNGSGQGNAPTTVTPRATDQYGSILKWDETGGDSRALTFDWDLFVLAGDPDVVPTGDGVDIQGDAFGSPDGIWCDPDRRVWIQTDVSNGAQRTGAYAGLGNNMMLAADPETREI